MHKVISVNLNGNAYQLDEAGYEALREYLARAQEQLKDNPDREEVMADLEQAIADKCQAYLGQHKTVVSTDEITRIVAEMGPVEGTTDAKGEPANQAAAGAKADEPRSVPPRRLYRVPGGAMIAGVCTGLAAYFQVDVTIVRAAFVVAGFLTKGVALIAYVVMMFVIPEASTPEEAAGGAPLNAKEVIDRANRRSREVGREWRRHWRQQRRDWRRQWPAAPPFAYGPPALAALLLPAFSLVHMALFLVMISMMISLVNTGAVLNWQLPPDVPVWAGALILLIAYQIVVAPFRVARHWNVSPSGGVVSGPLAFWSAVGSMIGLAFAIWLASNHIPEIREFLQRLPDLFRDFAWAMRDLVQRDR